MYKACCPTSDHLVEVVTRSLRSKRRKQDLRMLLSSSCDRTTCSKKRIIGSTGKDFQLIYSYFSDNFVTWGLPTAKRFTPVQAFQRMIASFVQLQDLSDTQWLIERSIRRVFAVCVCFFNFHSRSYLPPPKPPSVHLSLSRVIIRQCFSQSQMHGAKRRRAHEISLEPSSLVSEAESMLSSCFSSDSSQAG